MRMLCDEQPQIEPVFEHAYSCLGKKRYNTRRKAEGTAKKFAEVSNTSIQHCYHCPFCHGWHLTKMSDNESRWLTRQRRKEIRRTKKIKKAKWRFCAQNIGIDIPDEEAVLVPYGETYEID